MPANGRRDLIRRFKVNLPLLKPSRPTKEARVTASVLEV